MSKVTKEATTEPSNDDEKTIMIAAPTRGSKSGQIMNSLGLPWIYPDVEDVDSDGEQYMHIAHLVAGNQSEEE